MKKKVLIIDSDVSLLNSLSEDIMQAGFDVAVARNAHDGLNIAHEASLIIVAVELPDQNGFVVCSSLKHNPQTTNIPVFITSSAETTAAFEQHLNLANHADGYFLKPLDVATLIQEMVSIFADIDAAANEEMIEMTPQEADDADDSEVIKALSLDDMSLFEDIDSGSLEESAEESESPEMVVEPDPDTPAPSTAVSALPSSLAAPLSAPSSLAGGTALPKAGVSGAPKPGISPLSSKFSAIPPKPSIGTSPKNPSAAIPKPVSLQTSGVSGTRPSNPDILPPVGRASATFTAISQSAISAADSSRLSDEITVLKNEITVLKSEITTRDNRITMLQSQCDALTSRCQNAEAIAEALKTESAQMGAQFDEIAQKDATMNDQLQAMIKMDAEKTEQINTLLNTIAQKNQQIEAIAKQLQEIAKV
ncbi:MAG: response regulator [Proteobacteria bacterium]|nr:response regulator [Pseudomonadota bacterium]